VNKQKSQQGSGLLVIVIVLAVALLGAVGYIFWQNFFQIKSDETGNTNVNNTLTISEWGVKGKYAKTEDTLTYTINSANDNVTISSDKLESEVGCNAGSISRFTADHILSGPNVTKEMIGLTIADYFKNNYSSEDSIAIKKIGEYYFYENATQDCGHMIDNIPHKTFAEVIKLKQEFIDNLESI